MKARWMVGVMAVLVVACSNDVMVNGGGESAIVIRAHLSPDATCGLDVDSRVLSRGVFDIAEGGAPGSDACRHGYDLNLLVDNGSREDVVFESVEVRIGTIDDRTIVFSAADPPLPNPLTWVVLSPIAADSSAVVTAQVIPQAYAPFLLDFVDGSINLAVKLHGTTDGGVKVSSREQMYPVDICDGCLTMCYQNDVIDGLGMTPEEVYGETCPDDAGSDGRVCIDTDC